MKRATIVLLLCATAAWGQWNSNAKKIHGRPILPTAPTSNQVLQWDATAGAWKPGTGAEAGTDAESIRGVSVSATGPTTNQVLQYNGSVWLPVTLVGTTLCPTCVTSAAALTAHGVVIGAGLQAVAITGVGTAGQVLTSNGAGEDPTFEDPAAGAFTACTVARTDANTLTFFPYASATNPCVVRVGNTATRIVEAATVDLGESSVSANASLAYLYVLAGALKVGLSTDFTIGNVTCSAGCALVQPITAFPENSIPLFTWAAGTTDNEWDSDGATDYTSFLSTKNVAAGTGISITPSSGVSTVAIDSATTPQFSSGTSVPGSCTAVGQIFFDTDAGSGAKYYYCNGSTYEASGGSAAAITPAYWFPWDWQPMTTGTAWGASSRFQMFVPLQTTTVEKVSFYRSAASGDCGGTCGAKVGIYSRTSADCDTIVAQTAAITSGGTPDLNATGVLTASFTSPVTLTAGTTYWIGMFTDSTALAVYSLSEAATSGIHGAMAAGLSGKTIYGTGNAGSGTGGSVALPAACGTITGTTVLYAIGLGN